MVRPLGDAQGVDRVAHVCDQGRQDGFDKGEVIGVRRFENNFRLPNLISLGVGEANR